MAARGKDKTTVYLGTEDHRALKWIARQRGCTTAEVIREAVAEYAARHAHRPRARSVGGFGSGRRDLSERAEELLEGLGRDP